MHESPGGQAVPQPPQFLGSLEVSAHPVPQHCAVPAQVGPPLHPPPVLQTPATQAEPAAHALPHAPQLAASLAMSTSHPSATFMLQSANPALQLPM